MARVRLPGLGRVFALTLALQSVVDRAPVGCALDECGFDERIERSIYRSGERGRRAVQAAIFGNKQLAQSIEIVALPRQLVGLVDDPIGELYCFVNEAPQGAAADAVRSPLEQIAGGAVLGFQPVQRQTSGAQRGRRRLGNSWFSRNNWRGLGAGSERVDQSCGGGVIVCRDGLLLPAFEVLDQLAAAGERRREAVDFRRGLGPQAER
jgi:hypothetical protein